MSAWIQLVFRLDESDIELKTYRVLIVTFTEGLFSFKFTLIVFLCVGLLATEGVEIESFSAPADRTGDLWYCVGVSSPLRDLSALKSLAKETAQLTI